MRSILIRKRFLYFGLAVLFGVGLLGLGFFEAPAKLLKKEKAAAVQAGGPGPIPRPAGSALETAAGSAAGPAAVQAAAPAAPKDDFFIEYRLDRERTRGRQIELLRDLANNSAAGEQVRQKAQQELLTITGQMAKELELEHLLRAKGYPDATVCIEEKGVTVIVRPAPGPGKTPAKLSPEDVTKICEVVSWGTGVGEQHIIVIPKV